MDIPWTSLFSASVVVRVEDVYLLAGPVTDRPYDHARETALHNAAKQQVLQSLEPPSNTGTIGHLLVGGICHLFCEQI